MPEPLANLSNSPSQRGLRVVLSKAANDAFGGPLFMTAILHLFYTSSLIMSDTWWNLLE